MWMACFFCETNQLMAQNHNLYALTSCHLLMSVLLCPTKKLCNFLKKNIITKLAFAMNFIKD